MRTGCFLSFAHLLLFSCCSPILVLSQSTSLDLGVDVIRGTLTALLQSTLDRGSGAAVTLLSENNWSGAGGVATNLPIVPFNASLYEAQGLRESWKTSVVVVSEKEFFGAYKELFVTPEQRFGGVLVTTSSSTFHPAAGEFSPTAASRYNVDGLGLNDVAIPFPIVFLNESSSALVTAGAGKNLETQHSRGTEGDDQQLLPPFFGVTMNYSMSVEEGSGRNMSACLTERRCMPLGGVSVIGIPDQRTDFDEYTLATTAIDATAFIHEQAVGAVAASSGTAALLGVAQAFANLFQSHLPARNLRHKLVFGFFTGEAYGGIGSKSFIRDTQEPFNCSSPWGPDGVYGCTNPFRISSALRILRGKTLRRVVEISQVGNDVDSNVYLKRGTTSASNNALSASLNELGAGFSEGFPPTGAAQFAEATVLRSFEQYRNLSESWELLQITGYQREFTNEYFHSAFDDDVNLVNKDAVCKAASTAALLLASSVFAKENETLRYARIYLQDQLRAGGDACQLAQDALACLTDATPCDDAQDVLSGLRSAVAVCEATASDSCASATTTLISCFRNEETGGCRASNPLYSKYTGVYPYPRNGFMLPPAAVRYVHNKLSVLLEEPDITSVNVTRCRTNWDCGFNSSCSAGLCKESFVHYIDAVSVALKFEDDHFEVETSTLFDDNGESLWAESNWFPLYTRYFVVSPTEHDNAIALTSGLLVTVVSFALGFGLFWTYKRELKRLKEE